MGEELKRFLAGEPIHARPLSRPARLARWAKRNPALATATALMIILAIVGPAAAFYINGQRNRLAALVTEKDGLIGEQEATRQENVREMNRLGEQLDLWEGREKPSEFWPPAVGEGPKKMLLEKIFDKNYETAAAALKSDKLSGERLAVSHLALGIGCETLGKQAEARTHFLEASRTLETLAAEHLVETRFKLALADCYGRLSSLAETDQRDEAKEYLEKASALLQSIATSDADDIRSRAAGVESAVDGTMLTGYVNAKPSLDLAAALTEEVTSRWPTDPEQLYLLTAYLANVDPVLVTQKKPIKQSP